MSQGLNKTCFTNLCQRWHLTIIAQGQHYGCTLVLVICSHITHRFRLCLARLKVLLCDTSCCTKYALKQLLLICILVESLVFATSFTAVARCRGGPVNTTRVCGVLDSVPSGDYTLLNQLSELQSINPRPVGYQCGVHLACDGKLDFI